MGNEMNSLENAKVGDKLFVSNGMDESLETVERLTQTLVVTKYHRFAKNSGKLYGSVHWNALYARIATDEDIAMIRRKKMIRRCGNIDFSLLTTAQLEQILKIVNSNVKLD